MVVVGVINIFVLIAATIDWALAMYWANHFHVLSHLKLTTPSPLQTWRTWSWGRATSYPCYKTHEGCGIWTQDSLFLSHATFWYNKEVESPLPPPLYSRPVQPEGVERMQWLEKEFCVHQIPRKLSKFLLIVDGRSQFPKWRNGINVENEVYWLHDYMVLV